MPGDISSVEELIARTDSDPEFLRLLLFDQAKAAEEISDPALREKLAGLDPRVILSGLVGATIGAKGGAGKCDDTCGNNSCVDTCGDRSCHHTCSDDSCSRTCGEGSCDGTCNSSCGNTCGDRSCVDTTNRPLGGGESGAGGGFTGRNLDRVRADIDALIAQHVEPR